MYSPTDVIGSTHSLCRGPSISGGNSLYSDCVYRQNGLPWQPLFPTTPTEDRRVWTSHQQQSSCSFSAFSGGVFTYAGNDSGFQADSRSSFSGDMAREQLLLKYATPCGIFPQPLRDDRTIADAYCVSDSTLFDDARRRMLSATSGDVTVTRQRFPSCQYSSALAPPWGPTTSGWESSAATMRTPSNRFAQFYVGSGTFDSPLFVPRLPVHDASVHSDAKTTLTSCDNALVNFTSFETDASNVGTTSFWTSLDSVQQTTDCRLTQSTPTAHVIDTPVPRTSTQRDTPAAAQKSSKRSPTLFSQHTVAVLTAWYETHREHPYPDSNEIAQLTQDAGIKASQLRRWFANRRQRSANTKPIREIALRRRQRNEYK